MARITSIAKGGYYPFDREHIPAVSSMFQPAPEGGFLLDPCAGEGEALAALASALGLTPYANELDGKRAAACRKRFGLTQSVQGNILRLRTPHNAYVMGWVNPPYTKNTGGAEEKRREFEFLKHAWRWTQPGGFTLWVVYAHHVTRRAAEFLLANSHQVDIYRVPGDHLGAYPQVVIVARKAEKREVENEQVAQLVDQCETPDDLPELAVLDEPVYRFPKPAGVQRWYFHPDEITPDVMLPALDAFGAHLTSGFQALLDPPLPAAELTPIVPPRGGQIGLILAAGLFDGLLLDLKDGQAAVRGVVRTVEVNATPEGMERVREVYEHRPQVTITLLYKDGRCKIIDADDEAALVTFLKTHREAFLRYIDAHSQPMYDFDYDQLEGIFAQVFRNRRLPGRPVTGLFETQKHVVAAAYTALMERKGVIVVGEMGVGKSAIGAATVLALHAQSHLRPGEVAVVMCPPHLVEKWVRELHDAIPGCVAEIVKTVDDVTAFMHRAEVLERVLHVMVVSRERAKLGEGWEPAFMVRKEHIAQWAKGDAPPPSLSGQGRVVTQKHLCCPDCGEEITTRKDGTGRASVSWLKKRPRACVHCGSALWQLKRRWSGPREGEKFPKRNPRYPLASFLRQRYPDRVGVAVIDELHETKGGGTDQGRAMQDLVLTARKAIGLTGTLFGGVASSVFWLEWAFNPRMVETYPIDAGRAPALNRWTRAMGVLEQVIEYKEENAKSGAYTTTRRVEHAPREAPGISPHLVAELLDHCLWVGLADLNFALPDYVEVPVAVDLPPDVLDHYRQEGDRLVSYHMRCLEDGDATFLSTYFQAMLRYPSSCWRPKQVVHKLKASDVRNADEEPILRLVTTMRGFGESHTYPKEERLLELLAGELQEGRRCVVFVSQTGTLDIQPRLAELIERDVPGAEPFVLRQNTTATDKRDAYLERKVRAGHNVLIANPRLVQTGLDLIAFPTLLFYEVDNSLYVTSQASRRAWRIGQTHECRVYYLFYNDTMEARAIDLVARKQAAAALLGGDADGGGLAQVAGGANTLMAELAKTIAQDEAVVDVSSLFRQKAEQSEDFTSGWAASIAEAKARAPASVDEKQRASASGERETKAASKVSDFFRHYLEVKRLFPHALVFMQVGDFMEAFEEDAETVARELDLVLTSRRVSPDKRVKMAGAPVHALESSVGRLLHKGYAVTISEVVAGRVCTQFMGGKDRSARESVKSEAGRQADGVTRPLLPGLTPASRPAWAGAGEQLSLF